MIEIYSVSLIVLAMGLITIGWIQLQETNKNWRGEFLLKIDERFASPGIAKAEMIIQELFWRRKYRE